jgi:hypothetical protein
VPLQTGLVPSGRREATEAGSRRPNFCRTVLADPAFAHSAAPATKLVDQELHYSAPLWSNQALMFATLSR